MYALPRRLPDLLLTFLKGLNDDPWLKEQDIMAPGASNAPVQVGLVFWRLIDTVVQKVSRRFVPHPATDWL
jgi:hypothetical protein